eukprot:scaffold198709_cov31-Tisochrysis_lutea.AAC.2
MRYADIHDVHMCVVHVDAGGRAASQRQCTSPLTACGAPLHAPRPAGRPHSDRSAFEARGAWRTGPCRLSEEAAEQAKAQARR